MSGVSGNLLRLFDLNFSKRRFRVLDDVAVPADFIDGVFQFAADGIFTHFESHTMLVEVDDDSAIERL